MTARALLALSLPSLGQEAAILAAAVLLLLGARLCWGATHYRMSMEERAKDGKITEDQARWRIRTMDVTGPGLVVVGVAVLALALLA